MVMTWRFARPLSHVGVALGAMMISASAWAYEEAPMLGELTASGALPPVDERLPASPEVIEPLEDIGQYGGTIRRFLGGSNDHNSILRFVSPQGLTRWRPDFSGVIPNVAESWTVNDDGSEFTFHLREGMRWSDGHPFTADDIMFFVEDLLHNEEFYPNAPARSSSPAKP